MSPTRTPADTPAEQPRRLTLSQIVEQLLQRGSSEHSSVTLARNSKGETQIEVVVRTGDAGEVQTVQEAEAIAHGVYSRLRELYPYGAAGGTNGGES